MKKKKQNKKTIKQKFWEFTDRHPLFDRFINGLSDVLNKFMILYWIFALALIAIPAIISYYTLPENIRNESTAIIGSIFSLIVIPLIMNAINRKKENEAKRFEANKDLYLKLSELLIQVQSKKETDDNTSKKFRNFIVNNYDYMCVNFSTSLISEIYRTYRAYTNNQMDNVNVYAESCISYIRREGGNGKDFMYSSLILDLIKDTPSK